MSSPTDAVADEVNANGRYVIVPMPGGEVKALVLLDTKTGQNWIFDPESLTNAYRTGVTNSFLRSVKMPLLSSWFG